ncbi:YybS family protein [Clostridium sp. DL1XJH146]
MKKKITTKEIVEASLMSALIFIIAIISVYVPFLTSIGLFILPIPVTIIYIRYGFKTSILSVVTSLILIAILYNPIKAIIVTISYGLVGIVFGFCIKKKIKPLMTNMLLAITNIIVNIISFMLYTVFIYKTTFIQQIQELVNINKESIEITKGIYEGFGTSSAQSLEQLDQLQNILTVQMVLTIIPATLILTSLIQSLINYNLTRAVLKKIKIDVLQKIKPFDQLYLSNLFTAGILILWSVGVLINYIGISFGSYLSSTVMYLMLFIFVLNGIASSIYYLRNKRKMKAGKGLITVIIIFAFMSQFALNMFFFLGIIDSIMDLRRLDPYSFRKNKKGEKNG